MSTPVWTYSPAAGGFKVTRTVDKVVTALGDGTYRTALRSQAWTHQDGTGGASTSYRGYATFQVTLPVKVYSSDFTGPLDFLQARIDAGFESFYFYDPIVDPTVANWDGTNTAGRHLVKYLGDISYDGVSYQLSRFATFTFHEVQA